MTTMPVKLYVEEDGFAGVYARTPEWRGSEYIRADLVQELVKALEDALSYRLSDQDDWIKIHDALKNYREAVNV